MDAAPGRAGRPVRSPKAQIVIAGVRILDALTVTTLAVRVALVEWL